MKSAIPRNLWNQPVCLFTTASGEWNWSAFSHLLPAAVLLQITAVPPPHASRGGDKLYWCHSSTGSFSTRSAYSSLVQEPSVAVRALWKAIWAWPGPPRIRTFLWLLTRNRLLTNSERCRRHMSSSDGCVLCGLEEETSLHVVRDCLLAKTVWNRLLLEAVSSQFFNLPLDHWLELNLLHGADIGHMWDRTFGVVVWKMWQWLESYLKSILSAGTVYLIYANSNIDFQTFQIITEDLGVLKKVKEEGQGWEQPREPYEVKAWISGKSADGKMIFSHTQGEPFFFTFGKSEIPKGLEMGIGTMSRGEKAVIYVTKDYLTQSPLIPSIDDIAEIHFEVDLVHFVQVRDVLGDGRLIKRRLRDGRGDFPMDCPLQDSLLHVHYKAMLLNEEKTVFYDTKIDNNGQPFEFRSGEGLVPEGFEMCTRLMLPGEIALRREAVVADGRKMYCVVGEEI
ncbi:Peptidyl-prolyl cis-trans isomerase PASTICCINO1 [Striga hermonthica]|uniref:peptidylprolyl isomerase n=1 Tax=Striga hermonthica TaxID=68872 RepID=A0A9N7NUH9_STRHE|nr:Peptidyl-prolyl cis-trans isomerase PASTICCINO1 [Striga hermonthica]